MIFEVLAFVVILGLWWFKNDQSRFSKYPPGPMRLPIIGNILHIIYHATDVPSKTFKILANIYGDMLFVKVGQNESVVFNTVDTIHQMLTHEHTVGRFQFEVIKDRNMRKSVGLIWSYDKPWQTLRRFTVRNLRDFGFGKSSAMDAAINEETDKFLDHFSKEVKSAPGNVVHVTDPFSISVVNVLWRLVSGKTYDLDDPKMRRLVQLNNAWMKSTTVGFDLSEPFPILRDWFPNWTKRTLQMETQNELFEYGKQLLYEQRKLDNNDSEPETFIDVFSRKIETSKNDPETDFTDEQFVFTILDLFIAGSETSSNTLNFGMLYMTLYPEVQEKVQSEIDREIPEGISIDSTMKSRLPYTCATILEVLRYSSVIAIPAPRCATENLKIGDYHIKKGTALLANIYGAHYCVKEWGDPKNFRPERFLNSDGTAINQKVADRMISFGAGKRFCLGQSLAELSIFHYFVSMLRKFKFVKIPGSNITADPQATITLSPKPYDVRVIDRSRLQR